MSKYEELWSKAYDEGVRRKVEIPDINLYQLLERTAKRYPDKKATSYFNASLTYSQLLNQVDIFAAVLAKKGIGKGDRVAVMLPNCPQYLISYFALARLGAIVAQTSPLYKSDELLFELQDAECKWIILLDLLYPVLSPIEKQSSLEGVIFTRVSDYFPFHLKMLYPIKQLKEGTKVKVPSRSNYYWFKSLISQSTGTPPEVKIDPDQDVALFQFTGGTTGRPKGAQLTHKNVVANAYQTKEWLGNDCQEGKERILDVLPLFHSYGMTTTMNLSVLIGGTLILLPRFDLEQVLKIIEKDKPTLFPGVPTLYVAIINHPEIGKYDLSSIKSCISGAAPLPVEVQRRFEELTGGKLVEGYGLSEASPVTHCNPVMGRGKEGSIGIPMSNTRASIIDVETGEELPVGEKGELALTGPQVMKGYWKRPEETEAVLEDGWLYTGDIATMDEDGFFFIVDRKKDMIISGGFNVYPREVEEVLYEHPAVKEAVVCGISEEYHGEVVKAYIVIKEDRETSEEEIIAFCKEKLSAYKVPKEVDFRLELPKTMVGKILRRELRKEEEESSA